MPPAIFISYRREDSAAYAGRLYDLLSARFGQKCVFMDVDAIEPGSDFAEVIKERVTGCNVLIAVIGKQWLKCVNKEGRRRLDDPEDFVCLEIRTALARGIRVVPVLVGGAPVPLPQELPESLIALSRRQVMEIQDSEFHQDTARLIRMLAGSRFRRWQKVAVVALILLSAIAVAEYGGILHLRRIVRRVRVGAAPVWDVTGTWKGEVIPKGQSPYFIAFKFEQSGERLFGSVSYPTGEGGIMDGTIRDGQITFQTRHLPNFMDHEVTIHFQGNVTVEGIHFINQYEGGFTKFIAKRVTDR